MSRLVKKALIVEEFRVTKHVLILFPIEMRPSV
jgi:hypothetical protein